MEGNKVAWQIYNIANARDRQVGMGFAGLISSTAILHLCELYDATLEDFEKVLYIDGLLYKARNDEEEENRKIKEQAKDLAKSVKSGMTAIPRRKGKK